MQNQYYQVSPEHIDLFITGLLLAVAFTVLYVITRIMARHPVFILLVAIASICGGITVLLTKATPDPLNGLYAVLTGCILILAAAFAYKGAK